MTKTAFIGALGLVLAASLAMAGGGDRWLHVRVEEGGDDGERVRVNIPLSLVESILPHIEVDVLQHGRIDLDEILEDELDGEIDVRAILEEIRNVDDAEFVTVESPHENVRISKEKGFILVHVEELDGDETVYVRIPLTVVDAMLVPDSNELDLAAAVRALGDYGDGDLVTVESRNEMVRIWIDDKNVSK